MRPPVSVREVIDWNTDSRFLTRCASSCTRIVSRSSACLRSCTSARSCSAACSSSAVRSATRCSSSACDRGQLGAHPVELDEHLDLGAQDLRHDRRQDVVHRTQRVALHGLHVVGEGGHEDDGRVPRLLALADQRRGLQARHAGHVDVEQDDGELALEQKLQCLLARRRRDDVLVELLQGDLGRPDASRGCRPRPGWRRARRCSWASNLEGASQPLTDTARSAARPADGAHPPASTGSPRHRPRCSARDRPSWPWPSRR